MRALAAFCGALLLSSSALAEVTLLDSCEDTSYTTRAVAAGDSMVLNNVPTTLEGESALSITYNFTSSTEAWTKSGMIIKTLPEPVDLSDMDALEFDVNVAQANGSFMFIISLIDEKGYDLSTDLNMLFTIATSGFQTISIPLSSMVKNEWKGAGRAVNLRKIKQIAYNFPNQRAVAPDSLTFIMDNVKVVHGLGLVKEVMLENFESFADQDALASDYQTTGGAISTTLELVTDNPRTGKQALKLTGTFEGYWRGARARRFFIMPINLSKAKYLRFSSFGDPSLKGYNPMVSIYLRDRAGNNLIGRTWGWGEEAEWSDSILPFKKVATINPLNSCWTEDNHDNGGKEGKCDLSNIIGLSLAVEPQEAGPAGFPLTVSVLYDNIIVGTDAGTQMKIYLPR